MSGGTKDETGPAVLVVDDEAAVREELAEFLTGKGYVCHACAGAAEGLSRLGAHPGIGIVLLDLRMPGESGLDLLASCRRTNRRNLEFIVVTGQGGFDDAVESLRLDAFDFLEKPVSLPRLGRAVARAAEVLTLRRAEARLRDQLLERNRLLEQTLEKLRESQARYLQNAKLSALGNLAAGLLHEINNPLNFAMTALSITRSDSIVQESPDLSDTLGDVAEGMQRIHGVLCDLRRFARPQEGWMQERFRLAESVAVALKLTAAELKGIEVRQEIPADLNADGEPGLVVQLLVNLLTNAAQATRALSGKRQLWVRLYAAITGDRIRLTVSDNGVGMDEATQAQARDAFFTTRDVGEGMGLGLSVCHTIAELHGGELLLQSRPGEGTRVSFDLALASGESPEAG